MIGFIQKYGFSTSHSGTYQAWVLLNNGSVQLLADEKLCFIFGSEGKKGYDNVSKGAQTETLDSKG